MQFQDSFKDVCEILRMIVYEIFLRTFMVNFKDFCSFDNDTLWIFVRFWDCF